MKERSSRADPPSPHPHPQQVRCQPVRGRGCAGQAGAQNRPPTVRWPIERRDGPSQGGRRPVLAGPPRAPMRAISLTHRWRCGHAKTPLGPEPARPCKAHLGTPRGRRRPKPHRPSLRPGDRNGPPDRRSSSRPPCRVTMRASSPPAAHVEPSASWRAAKRTEGSRAVPPHRRPAGLKRSERCRWHRRAGRLGTRWCAPCGSRRGSTDHSRRRTRSAHRR